MARKVHWLTGRPDRFGAYATCGRFIEADRIETQTVRKQLNVPNDVKKVTCKTCISVLVEHGYKLPDAS